MRTERLDGNLGGFASMMPGGSHGSSLVLRRRRRRLLGSARARCLAGPARPGLRYSIQEDGIQAATQFARAAWRLSHEPTGVRVQTPMGGWEVVRTFGDDAADAVA